MFINVKWLGSSNTTAPTEGSLIVVENGKPTFKNKNDISIGQQYTHPTSHPASMIVEDSSHRFVTDTEKSSWASKVVLFTDVATNYTLKITDQNRLISTTTTSSITITIPNDSTLNFPIGAQVSILKYNTGDITITGSTGVTVRYVVENKVSVIVDGDIRTVTSYTTGNKLNVRYSIASIVKLANNEWLLSGNLVA